MIIDQLCMKSTNFSERTSLYPSFAHSLWPHLLTHPTLGSSIPSQIIHFSTSFSTHHPLQICYPFLINSFFPVSQGNANISDSIPWGWRGGGVAANEQGWEGRSHGAMAVADVLIPAWRWWQWQGAKRRFGIVSNCSKSLLPEGLHKLCHKLSVTT